MSDLPNQSRFQQVFARNVSGEELEVLGKTAASKWLNGETSSLSSAVITTVKHAGLSPEQVKRVCEFTNSDAFLREFKKESAVGHKVVEFVGGPADPAFVIQELNSGGGGSVFDPGTGDYHAPPTEKRASDSRVEDALASAFGTDQNSIPYAEPLADVMDMRDKLGGALDHLSAQLSGLETAYADLSDSLYRQVKQAALTGSSLGEISQLLESGAPSEEYLKIAFSMVTPRLLQDRVFSSLDAALASMDKTASNRMVNHFHPLVGTMTEFSDCLQKLAQVRLACDELNRNQAQATAFLKQAGQEGVIIRAGKTINEAAYKAAPRVGQAAEKVVGKLVHEDAGRHAKEIAETAVRHAPKVVGALGAADLARRAVNNPAVNKVYHGAQGHLNPLSQDWDIETARQQGQFPGY